MYTDTHDISRDQKDYDVLISDIDHTTLETKATKVGVSYLSEVPIAEYKFFWWVEAISMA